MKPILFIHPRRGLFQLTSCNTCHYKFGCDNCDCNLTTYRTYESNMQLLCHQCQTFYNFPKVCPMCKGSDISSNFGGVDELIEVLKKDFGKDVIKVESKTAIDYDPKFVYVTTRVFDPSLEYNKFSKIIFIRAENLLASPDYLVNEDVHRSLVELFLQVDETTEVVFDTNNPDLLFFQELAKLNSLVQDDEVFSESFDEDINLPDDCHSEQGEESVNSKVVKTTSNLDNCSANISFMPQDDTKNLSESTVTTPLASLPPIRLIKRDLPQTIGSANPPDGIFRFAQDDQVAGDLGSLQKANSTIIDWYTSFVEEESRNRQKFLFPPFYNLILLTTQEKSKEKSIQKINSTRQYLFGYKNQLKSLTIGSPYQAKFLKRKGMFSHHLLLRFPRQYGQYFELRDIVKSVSSTYNLQARLNPRHLF
jgi:primosomal protein N'